MRKLVRKSYAAMEIEEGGFEDVVLNDLYKIGLQGPEDIEDVEFIPCENKYRYVFWIEKEEQEND